MIKNYECCFSKQNHLFRIYVNIPSESRLGVLQASSYVKGKGIFVGGMTSKLCTTTGRKSLFILHVGDIYSTRSCWLVLHATGILLKSLLEFLGWNTKVGKSILSSVVLRCSTFSVVQFTSGVLNLAVSLGSMYCRHSQDCLQTISVVSCAHTV